MSLQIPPPPGETATVTGWLVGCLVHMSWYARIGKEQISCSLREKNFGCPEDSQSLYLMSKQEKILVVNLQHSYHEDVNTKFIFLCKITKKYIGKFVPVFK
jgi:hypothetical protein